MWLFKGTTLSFDSLQTKNINIDLALLVNSVYWKQSMTKFFCLLVFENIGIFFINVTFLDKYFIIIRYYYL